MGFVLFPVLPKNRGCGSILIMLKIKFYLLIIDQEHYSVTGERQVRALTNSGDTCGVSSHSFPFGFMVPVWFPCSGE